MRPRRALLLVAVLVIAAVACFGEAWHTAHQPRRLAIVATRHRAASTPLRTAPPTAGQSPATASGEAAEGDEPASPPVRVDVPAVGISAPVQPVGQAVDGSIDLPPPAVAGWYTGGPAPGTVGPAVLVGHIDSQAGPAVFYPLTGIRGGDVVSVARADGSSARFVISSITEVKKSEFPTAAVFAPTDGPSLRLVTCTGQFDTTQHHYVDSLIAWATAAP